MDTLLKKILFIGRNMAKKNFEYMKQQGYGKMGIGQMAIAKIVLDTPGVYADDVCRSLELDKATVAIGIKRLMAGGYISREVDEQDKRKKKLFVTPKLNKISDALNAQMSERMKKLTKGFTPSELKNFNSYLDKIKNNLLEED